MIKQSLAASMAVVMGTAILASATAVPAQAKVIKVCVKKSTGEMRMLTKKKCKKGWKKQTWNAKGATGPKGDTGAQGPRMVVKDGTGATVGYFMGTFPGSYGVYAVEVNGGSFIYLSNGRVYGSSSPRFKTNICTGTAYAPADTPVQAAIYTGMAGGTSRVLYRRTDPDFGPARAWAFTTTTELVNQNLYRLDDTGTCVLDALHNGIVVSLQDVAAPADVTPPLTIQ